MIDAGSSWEIALVRHAPVAVPGRLFGRTDAPAKAVGERALEAFRQALDATAARVVSPARRCRETAAAIWPDLPPAQEDARLWEQDFGAWENREFESLPDLGPRPPAELIAFQPPGGESFEDMCRRVGPALEALAAAGPAVVVAHAGTVRAALALALGDCATALSFEVDPLSITRIRCLGGGRYAVASTNWRPR